MLDVQLEGTYREVQIFAESMDERMIIPISSNSDGLSIPNLVPYTTAKGGIDAFTRVAARTRP
ncbi:MAG: SDR family oxidoreductase [Natronomonas sp.]|nr:SDR family oxidoreductase [Natronomonas sp.]MDR9430651.1 SDR family oxidoreductase [Natronomonas sp.]